MSSAAAFRSASAAPSRRRVVRILIANGAFWFVVSILGALTSLNDDLRAGVQGSFWLIWRGWACDVAGTAAAGTAFYLAFSRWPQLVARARNIALCYGALLLVLLPFQMVFLLKLTLREDGPGLSWASIEKQAEAVGEVATWSGMLCISAVFFATVAIKVWQQNQVHSRNLAQARADSLALRLALERQRGLALRAQLEPHFVFNALNAISALVRSDGKEAALQGIQGLSDLLRYALAAGEKDWVSLAEELAFVEGYVALQRLRYSARLRVAVEGVGREMLSCDCPPLLLQPLVENALRHDLDCHEEASDIHLSFSLAEEFLTVRVGNPVRESAAQNPGTGLGLRNTAERLALAYGGAAIMQSGIREGRFEVELRLPAHASE